VKLQLIEGRFEANEAIEIITRLIQVKIKFHEGKIRNQSSEDDIKMREKRIKQLQKELFEIRQVLGRTDAPVNLESTINITKITDEKPETV
jgi:hypothetical protein